MKCKSVCSLPEPDSITDSDGILITQDGKTKRMCMPLFRDYVGYASGADVLGVPVPTAAKAGLVPAVNADGNGYVLVALPTFIEGKLWESENPGGGVGATTISVPGLAECDSIKVFLKRNSNYGGYFTQEVQLPFNTDDEMYVPISVFDGSNGYWSNWQRLFYINKVAETIRWGRGLYSYSGSSAYSNTAMEPIAIYGRRQSSQAINYVGTNAEEAVF